MEHFGERLRKAREKRGLTHYELAKTLAKIGMITAHSSIVIGKYERGEIYPSAHKLHDICLVLGVSADYLLGLKETED